MANAPVAESTYGPSLRDLPTSALQSDVVRLVTRPDPSQFGAQASQPFSILDMETMIATNFFYQEEIFQTHFLVEVTRALDPTKDRS